MIGSSLKGLGSNGMTREHGQISVAGDTQESTAINVQATKNVKAFCYVHYNINFFKKLANRKNYGKNF